MQRLLNFWLLPVIASVCFRIGCPSAIAPLQPGQQQHLVVYKTKLRLHTNSNTQNVFFVSHFQAGCMFHVHMCCKCCSRFKPACDWDCHLSTANQFVLSACAAVRCCYACNNCRPCWNWRLSLSQPPLVIMTTGNPGSIEQDNIHTACFTIGRP